MICKYCNINCYKPKEKNLSVYCRNCKTLFVCAANDKEISGIKIRTNILTVVMNIWKNETRFHFNHDMWVNENNIYLDYIIDDLTPDNANQYYEKLKKTQILN